MKKKEVTVGPHSQDGGIGDLQTSEISAGLLDLYISLAGTVADQDRGFWTRTKPPTH